MLRKILFYISSVTDMSVVVRSFFGGKETGKCSMNQYHEWLISKILGLPMILVRGLSPKECLFHQGLSAFEADASQKSFSLGGQRAI